MIRKNIQHYVEKFTNLNRDWNWKFGPAPNKPVLLRTVIAMIENDRILENRITLSEELRETFVRFWPRSTARQPNITTPFDHLSSEGFWHDSAKRDGETKLQDKKIGEKSERRERITVAYLDEELFAILTHSIGRETLRQALIQEYFPERRNEIDIISAEVRETEEYESLLLGETERSFEPIKKLVPICPREVRIRREGFRRAIMRLYDFSCAVCHLSIVTADGHSATEATHIIPRDVSHNDDVRNGISLCPVHRWAFLDGLISLCDSFHVIVSATLARGSPTARVLINLNNNPIRRPNSQQLWPAHEAIEWHRTHVFRKE